MLENFGLVPIITLYDDNMVYSLRNGEVVVIFIFTCLVLFYFAQYLASLENKKGKVYAMVFVLLCAAFSVTLINDKPNPEIRVSEPNNYLVFYNVTTYNTTQIDEEYYMYTFDLVLNNMNDTVYFAELYSIDVRNASLGGVMYNGTAAFINKTHDISYNRFLLTGINSLQMLNSSTIDKTVIKIFNFKAP